MENQSNNVEELKRVKLFCVSSSIFEYYPSVGSLYHFLFEKRYSKSIWLLVPILFFYYFHNGWFFIADIWYKNTEFKQRRNMSNGTDDYLEGVELFLGRIWNFNSIVYLFSLLYSLLGNGAFLYVIIWTSAWALNQQFLMLKIKCQYPNLKFNCLHRQTLLFNLSFWKAFWGSLILSDKRHICIRVLAAIACIIPLTLIAVVCIMCPLLDIILHYPLFIIILQQIRKNLSSCRPILRRHPECSIFSDDEKDDSNTRTVNTGSFKFTVCNFSQCRPSAIVVISKVLALLYYITIFVAYIYPIATVCSMIVSYTIIGIMKNWDSLLPKLVLVGIAFSYLVKLLFGAYQPLHDLQ